jgi:hypothetical protein
MMPTKLNSLKLMGKHNLGCSVMFPSDFLRVLWFFVFSKGFMDLVKDGAD